MSKLNWRKTVCLVFVLFGSAVMCSAAESFSTLANFNGTNGAVPQYGSLVQGLDGNFYGTTSSGGTNDNGIVFKMTPTGTLTTLYNFCSQANCADGAGPAAGLVQATNGLLYGTTSAGGASSECDGGCGTVFDITPGGVLTTLHSFDGTDGAVPLAGLVQATNGLLYGTTLVGGADNRGTVFVITPGGRLTTLYDFCSQANCTDGDGPVGGLVQATNGLLYGTTQAGGTDYSGTVFQITAGGVLTTLHSFDGSDGSRPLGSLVQASNGNFYGTTNLGGTVNEGTVFEITPAGTLVTLYNFCSQAGCTDGARPVGGLIQATDGNFYGTTQTGGAGNYGTIFEITAAGLTTLYSFDEADGFLPYGGLLQSPNGSFYGTTSGGGAGNDGTIYTLDVGLGPFVKTLPTSGSIGTAVSILGNNLTGTTNVTFNGTPAAFTILSNTAITTSVPLGATTGPVTVQTPGGELTSNVSFLVP
jgi:uncharacterized repeat protein (TIGR03803 family)